VTPELPNRAIRTERRNKRRRPEHSMSLGGISGLGVEGDVVAEHEGVRDGFRQVEVELVCDLDGASHSSGQSVYVVGTR
jgi:hypothetical protein